MFFLSKIIPLFFLPLGFSILLLIIKLFNKNKFYTYLSLFILYFFSIGSVSNYLTKFVEKPWERLPPSLIKKADAIVILSSGDIFQRGDYEIIEWSDPDRFLGGISLYKEGRAPKIIFTGEIVNKNITTGNLYIEEAKKLGIPEQSLFTTSNVNNTKDEAIKLRLLLNDKSNNFRNKIILVTSAFHMTRSKTIFERNGFEVIPFPVDFKVSQKRIINNKSHFLYPYNWIPNSLSLKQSSRALREIIGRIIYKTW